MKKLLILLLVLAVSASLFAGGGGQKGSAAGGDAALDRSKQRITVLSGPTSGVYYPIGGAFSSYIKQLGYQSDATATGASAENINYILSNQGELAIAMSDSVIQAYDGTGAFQGKPPAKDLRAMMGLWPNVVQIVTTTDTGIKSFTDLKGKRVGVGAPNSGVELNARMIFEAHGMTYADCGRVDYLNYGESIEQMKNGQCDVAFVTSGLGNATIRELGVTKTIYFVPVEGAGLRKLRELYPFFAETTIPGSVYGVTANTITASVPNIMLVAKSLPSRVVYDLLENFYSPEGVKTIGQSHAQAAEHIIPANALRGIQGTVVPLHDGAIEYYKAKGVIK